MKNYTAGLSTEIGDLMISASDDAVLSVEFVDECETEIASNQNRITDLASAQLEEYFSGERKVFDLPLAPQGTDFQKMVWQELCSINYGTTASYLDIANAIGKPTASRAVGMANGKNPIAIIIPCHRIIGSNGKLTGYAGGLDAAWRVSTRHGVRQPTPDGHGGLAPRPSIHPGCRTGGRILLRRSGGRLRVPVDGLLLLGLGS